MGLTKKQKEVYDFISHYEEVNGYAPTQMEIGRHFKLKSLGSVQKYIQYLMEEGLVVRNWNARRGLKLHGTMDRAAVVPLLGNVAAGKPIEAIENVSNLSVSKSLLKGDNCFALNVCGDSMIEDGILDGDIIIVRKQANAEQGETVVALINGEATVKKFYRNGNNIELRPANENLSPLFVSAGDFGLGGVVISLMRKY